MNCTFLNYTFLKLKTRNLFTRGKAVVTLNISNPNYCHKILFLARGNHFPSAVYRSKSPRKNKIMQSYLLTFWQIFHQPRSCFSCSPDRPRLAASLQTTDVFSGCSGSRGCIIRCAGQQASIGRLCIQPPTGRRRACKISLETVCVHLLKMLV